MATAPSRTLVGSVISQRWRLVQKLGHGAMGEVYAADPVSGGPRVALKVLRAEFLGEGVVLARFAETGRACMSLVHPNVVRVMECATGDDGSPYLVMELLDGVPLGAYTQDGGRVPVAQAVAILQGILAGLAAAHARGMIHVDLKPDNVFLNRHSGGTFMVKVLDFGMAKVIDAAGGVGRRTLGGATLGTVAYMSPEQLTTPGDVDARADLWGAGVIFYEMLTGRAPFPAPTEYARRLAISSTEPEPIDRIDPTLAAFVPFVARAFQKNRKNRFGSAPEMARALSRAPQSDSGPVAEDGPVPPSAAQPLTRLPVPSQYADSVLVPVAHGEPLPAETTPIGRERPGGTLPSAEDADASAEPVRMVKVDDFVGTLPSQDLPRHAGNAMRPTRMTRVVIAALIAFCLAAGFLFGWVAARAR